NAGSASAAAVASTAASAAGDRMKASGTAMSGRTKSGPTVQAASATVSAADFSNSSAADVWSLFMGSFLVSAGGQRQIRPAFREVMGWQLFEQPADVFDRRDARFLVSHGTPPRSRLFRGLRHAVPA